MTQTTNSSQSPLDPYRSHIEGALPGRSYQSIADELNARYSLTTTRHSIRRAIKRWGIQRTDFETPGLAVNGDEAKLISKPERVIMTPDELLIERGLDPSEWEVTSLKVNQYDAMTSDKAEGDNRIVTMRQLVVHCKRLVSPNWVVPARVPGDYIKPTKLIIHDATKPVRRVVFVGDQQAPYQDPHLHQLFCEWLEHNKPDEGVLIGDTVDFPDISRHPDNEVWHRSAQECLDSAYVLLRDYVQSNEDTTWTKLIGNHDERVRTRLLNFQTRLVGLRPAAAPDEEKLRPVWHISNLLRLDELGITVIDPLGNYDQAQLKLSKHLAARHGWIAKKGSGASALATLEHLGFSIVVGHTHRQSIVHKTTHDIDGQPSTLAAVETGCMCRIQDGLGYAVAPDWQNGFATATIWPDGKFKLELATYVNDGLYYRDQRYT